jgi:SAM-dependent methyltransferase
MVSQQDIDLVSAVADTLDRDSVVVEFGPWLGAFSLGLARKTNLHVVDSFIWTKAHNKRLPDQLKVDENFRQLFEDIINESGSSVTIHETYFEDFRWTGAPIDLVVIDAPKTSAGLEECLSSVIPHLSSECRILLKHGLSPAFSGMASYVTSLIENEVLTLPKQFVTPASTMLVLSTGPNIAKFSEIYNSDSSVTNLTLISEKLKLNQSHPFWMLPVVDAVRKENWIDAFDNISKMIPNPALISAWDKIESRLLKQKIDLTDLTVLSEVFTIHHDAVKKDDNSEPFHTSVSAAYRGYWLNNSDKDWRGRCFHPAIIKRAFDFGYMSWPSKVRDTVNGKDILDVGCGPGLHGIGYLVAGAHSYVGLDPIVKLDKDRVKNLTAKTKDSFGWSPNEISDLIDPWTILPTPIEDMPVERSYDLATLHNVTEHLHELDAIFKGISLRLRKGGKILYNHHNFYTWNGHHLPPKTVSAIDITDPAQMEMLDWGHVEYAPSAEHYIARGLNRIRLDDLIKITKKYFDIEVSTEVPSKLATGHDRLTDEIRQRYPYLDDRDFLTQNLFCIATVRI